MAISDLKFNLLVIPIVFVIDLSWLGLIARTFDQKSLAHLLCQAVNWPAAALFHGLYLVGLLFAVTPALEGLGLKEGEST